MPGACGRGRGACGRAGSLWLCRRRPQEAEHGRLLSAVASGGQAGVRAGAVSSRAGPFLWTHAEHRPWALPGPSPVVETGSGTHPMFTVISLVLLVAVLAGGAAGLFGGRRRRSANPTGPHLGAAAGGWTQGTSVRVQAAAVRPVTSAGAGGGHRRDAAAGTSDRAVGPDGLTGPEDPLGGTAGSQEPPRIRVARPARSASPSGEDEVLARVRVSGTIPGRSAAVRRDGPGAGATGRETGAPGPAADGSRHAPAASRPAASRPAGAGRIAVSPQDPAGERRRRQWEGDEEDEGDGGPDPDGVVLARARLDPNDPKGDVR